MKEKSQTDRLYEMMNDGLPHRTDEIQARIYGNVHAGLARAGARVYDMKRKYKLQIKGWTDPKNATLYWYQIISPLPTLTIPSAFSTKTQKMMEDKNNEPPRLI